MSRRKLGDITIGELLSSLFIIGSIIIMVLCIFKAGVITGRDEMRQEVKRDIK